MSCNFYTARYCARVRGLAIEAGRHVHERHTMSSLSRVVALVTGAASGLGRATAARIIQQGGRVVLCDVQAQKGLETSSQFGDRCEFIQADVSACELLILHLRTIC